MPTTDPKGHNPNKLDKWLLVRYKKFATKEEIPQTISSIMMRRVHDQARVHASLILMMFSVIGMFTYSMIGKYSVKQGQSLEKMHIEYQNAYNLRKEKELQNTKNN